MTAFIDTSAFLAIMDSDDEMHARAESEWERLLDSGASFRTTNYVLAETSALIQDRIGIKCLRAFVADVVPVLEVIWVDQGTHLSAQHALLVSSRRDLSLVDCASFEAMRRSHIDHVFCFDFHFAQQGFEVLPS